MLTKKTTMTAAMLITLGLVNVPAWCGVVTPTVMGEPPAEQMPVTTAATPATQEQAPTESPAAEPTAVKQAPTEAPAAEPTAVKQATTEAPAAEPTAVKQATTEPETKPAAEEQPLAKEETAAVTRPYRRATRGGYRRFSDDNIDERRAQMRAWADARRENLDRYHSARRWWSNPWAESRRHAWQAYHDDARNRANQYFEQSLQESERLRGQGPFASGSEGWGPYGSSPSGFGPFGPTHGSWGGYPRY